MEGTFQGEIDIVHVLSLYYLMTLLDVVSQTC